MPAELMSEHRAPQSHWVGLCFDVAAIRYMMLLRLSVLFHAIVNRFHGR